jgi:hypothetical protein
LWWSLLLVAGSIIVVLLIAWRLGRYQRPIDDELAGEGFDPPVIHDRAGPFTDRHRGADRRSRSADLAPRRSVPTIQRTAAARSGQSVRS